MIMLEVKNLKKSFSSTEVIHDISFSMDEGETVSIIGSSGSGKTTLLRCLNFLETPDGGVIKINDDVLFDSNAEEPMSEEAARKKRLHFGMVFQSFNLFPQYTALENVTLAPSILAKGYGNSDITSIENRGRELLADMGLSDRMQNYPHELSGGQQQRVAIARALAKNPKILLCDEPTGALDYNTGKAILKLLEDTCKNTKKTVIVITHNQAITQMADRVITVKSGKIESIKENDKKIAVEDITW